MVDVLKAGRSKTCRIEGLRNESSTWGRGRMEVASAEAVMGVLGRETRGAPRIAGNVSGGNALNVECARFDDVHQTGREQADGASKECVY